MRPAGATARGGGRGGARRGRGDAVPERSSPSARARGHRWACMPIRPVQRATAHRARHSARRTPCRGLPAATPRPAHAFPPGRGSPARGDPPAHCLPCLIPRPSCCKTPAFAWLLLNACPCMACAMAPPSAPSWRSQPVPAHPRLRPQASCCSMPRRTALTRRSAWWSQTRGPRPRGCACLCRAPTCPSECCR